jgi:hypothetical protein
VRACTEEEEVRACKEEVRMLSNSRRRSKTHKMTMGQWRGKLLCQRINVLRVARNSKKRYKDHGQHV